MFDGQLEPGTGPIFLDQVNCDGSESQLLDCIITMAPHTCDHSEDVFISCQGNVHILTNVLCTGNLYLLLQISMSVMITMESALRSATIPSAATSASVRMDTD